MQREGHGMKGGDDKKRGDLGFLGTTAEPDPGDESL